MRWFYLFPLVLPLLAGCGSGPYKLAPVSGRVTLNGKPLTNAAVTFQPTAEGKINPGPGSGAFTDSDGHYALKLDGTDNLGAVMGKHMVRITLTHQDNPADDRPKRFKDLPAKYNSRTKLEYDVPAGGTESADF